MKRINIAKYASGSWPDNIGDTTLFYTSDTSNHARNIAGLFLDNPPVLSPDHASLVWRYYQDVDKFILIHVQGSHVISAALGRNYPFRAGYEVSREELNTINFNLFTLFEAIPKIANMPSGRVDLEEEVDDSRFPQNIWIDEDLALCIEEAVLTGKQIYIAQDIPESIYKNDGIFNAKELKVLLSTIYNLPIDLRRYVTFGIAVDNHFYSVLDGVTVIIYEKGCGMTIPDNAIHFSWGQKAPFAKSTKPQNFILPGKEGKLWTPEELVNALRIQKRIDKGIDSFAKEDWKHWLAQKHTLSELRTNSWETFEKYYQMMDDKTRVKYINEVRQSSVTWDIKGLKASHLELMGYDSRQMCEMQCKALGTYLNSNRTKYGFLYPKGQIPADVIKTINAHFIQSLNLSSSKDITRWYKIIEDNKCMSEEVIIQLSELFKLYVAPIIPSFELTIRYMKEYPMILSSSYIKPKSMDGVSQKEIEKLDKAHQNIISLWWRETVNSHKATDFRKDVSSVLNGVLGIIDDRSHLNEEFLKNIDIDSLYNLIISDNCSLRNCEELLAEITSKALPKEWKDFAITKALPTVMCVLFDEKKSKPLFTQDYLCDVRNWPKLILEYKNNYPLIYHLIQKQLNNYFKADTNHTFISNIKDTFIKKDDDKGIIYTDDAETTYPLINQYIMTIKNNNPGKAEELENLFKELQSVKNKKMNKHKLKKIFGLGGMACGFLIFAILFLVYLWLSPSKNENETVYGEGLTLSFSDASYKNPMLKIADIGLETLSDVCQITIDSCTYENMVFDNIDSLRHINSDYYNKLHDDMIIHKAIVNIYAVNEKGDSVGMGRDSRIVDRDNPLLSINEGIQWRIECISVINGLDTIKIDIPNDRIASDTTRVLSMRDVKYYFDIIRYIDGNLPKDKVLNIAY